MGTLRQRTPHVVTSPLRPGKGEKKTFTTT